MKILGNLLFHQKCFLTPKMHQILFRPTALGCPGPFRSRSVVTLRALILFIQTLALYKSFTYLLTYLLTYTYIITVTPA